MSIKCINRDMEKCKKLSVGYLYTLSGVAVENDVSNIEQII